VPAYTITIVCLANSRKTSGRCVAGKVLDGGKLGEWVRPVSPRLTGEVSEEERRYEDGSDPKLLDIIEIPMSKASPDSYQQENHVIDTEYHWRRRGRATWDDIAAALDQPPSVLWTNGFSTVVAGENDRVPEVLANNLTSSLRLIQPQNLIIWVGAPGADYGNPRRKVRSMFRYADAQYNIGVTDPVIEREYFAKANGEYPVANAILCISLGELHEGYAYKLVAAIITPERIAAGI